MIIVPQISWNRLTDAIAPSANGQVPVWNSTTGKWTPAVVSGVGDAIASVGLSAPAIFSVTGSPLTASGTISFSLVSQTVAKVFASPAGASGAPTFRSLVAGDLPSLPESQITNLIADLAARAPLSHSHSESDITNLISDLAGKAATSHTHTLSQITDAGTAAAKNADNSANNTVLLDGSGKLATSVFPALILSKVDVVVSQAAMLALISERGDMAIRTDTGKSYVLSTDSPSVLADWKEITASGAVVSVNGQTGTVVLSTANIAEGSNLYYTDVRAAAAAPIQSVAGRTGTVILGQSDISGLVAALSAKLAAASNLSDLGNTATARNNLGLGSAATHANSDYAASVHTHPQSDITSLVSDLALKAPLASPVHTGTTTDANLNVSGDIAHASNKIDKVVVLTDGATTTFDLSLGDMGRWTIGGARTFAVSNGHSGSFEVHIIQDGTGSRIWTPPASFKFSGGSALSTAPGAIDKLNFSSSDGGTTYLASITAGHA